MKHRGAAKNESNKAYINEIDPFPQKVPLPQEMKARYCITWKYLSHIST